MRNFISNHIRLVTFLVVLALFLAVFIPVAYYESKDYLEDRGDTRAYMNTSDLQRLADQAPKGTLKPADFTKYRCAELQAGDEKYAYYFLEVEPCYNVMVAFNKDTNNLMYFVVADFETDQEIDVLNGGNLREHFNNKG